jgi:hypothetical protein
VLQSNYYSYQKVKAADPDGPMGGYTRLLHFGQHDDMMHIIPTVVFDQLPSKHDPHLNYKPMHRCDLLLGCHTSAEPTIQTSVFMSSSYLGSEARGPQRVLHVSVLRSSGADAL